MGIPMSETYPNWATMIDIILAGLEGDQQKVRSYAELLLKLVQEKDLPDNEAFCRALRRALEGEYSGGNLIYPARDESSQVQEGMLQVIGRMFGPAVKFIHFDDGSSFALPEWEARKDPLVGYGDTISIGDWARITEHSKEEREVSENPLPQQIIYISPETPPSVAYAVRDGGCPFFDARLVGDRRWLTFRKVAVEEVPLYLREPLPLPVGVTRSVLRQLTKQQILTQFAGQAEVTCYVAVAAFDCGPIYVVRHEMMPLALAWEQQAGKRRPILTSLRPKYTYVNGDFEHWDAGERQIQSDGRVVARKQRYSLCLYDAEGQGPGLMELLEHAETPGDKV